MSRATEHRGKENQHNRAAASQTGQRAMWHLWVLLCFGAIALAMPTLGRAESRTGSNSAQASLNFRIVIPAIIRVKPVTQPDRIVIEDRHVADGYIDLDAGTAVNLTVNSREGYVLSANYDSQLLSKVEVRVSRQNLTASSGHGSMRVASGLLTDQVVPFSYRLHLAPGVRAGNYRWPVALAFSLATA